VNVWPDVFPEFTFAPKVDELIRKLARWVRPKLGLARGGICLARVGRVDAAHLARKRAA
jgi:hypothetical protein